MNTITRSLCVGAALLLALTIQVHAQTTAFTYQGVLAENGAPFTGNAEIQATLWLAILHRDLRSPYAALAVQIVFSRERCCVPQTRPDRPERNWDRFAR